MGDPAEAMPAPENQPMVTTTRMTNSEKVFKFDLMKRVDGFRC